MRIGYTSDIHIDVNRDFSIVEPLITRTREKEIDLLILAGDISSSIAFTTQAIDYMENRLNIPVLHVLGNHDYWELNTGLLLDRNHFLNRLPYVFGDWAIIGDTGWYDYSWRTVNQSIDLLRKGKLGQGRTWPDHRFIKWPYHLDAESFCALTIDSLHGQHAKAKTMGASKFVVITHMVPHRDLLREKPEYAPTNAFFGGSSLQQAITAISPEHVIFGHTHEPKDKTIDRTHYHCSPLGYYFEWRSGFPQEEMIRALSVLSISKESE